MKIATLGPEGTFSHEAVLKHNENAKIVFVSTISDVFEAIENKKAEYGLIPVENSLGGSVGISLDALWKYNHKIKNEIIIRIDHYLCGVGNIKDIKEVYSHSQALNQCKDFLRKLNVKTIPEASTAYAAKLIVEKNNKTKACICSKFAAKTYNLKILAEKVQDNKNAGINETRFCLINNDNGEETGNDKTSLAMSELKDRPGMLRDILNEFAKRNINLTKIESRPSRKRLGVYIFYIDCEGHINQKKIKEAIENLDKYAKMIKVFGSYPRGKS